MTTLNTIIEEEKTKATDILLGGENTEPEDVWHTAIYDEKKEKLDAIVTSAIQRAYEAGEREADAKWERKVEDELIPSASFHDECIQGKHEPCESCACKEMINRRLGRILSKIRS